MKRKSLILILAILVFLIIFTTPNMVSATELKTRLDIMQNASETVYLENNQGYISKTIVDSNSDTGEVTIELKLSNTKKNTEINKDTEIFLVVDNSLSMDFVTSTGETRKELILNSAKQLVTAIFENSNNVKMGLIDFHGEAFLGLGPAYHAKIRLDLTNDKDAILEAIQQQLQRDTVSGTNIEAGLQKAQENFSETANNKIIILLTDGIPNADVNGTEVEDANDVTDVGCIQVGINTKNTLLNLKNSGIYTITMLTGMSELDGNTDKDGNVYDENTLEEKLQAAENIFGTPTNPTANKYYLVNSLDINKIITEDILKDVTEIVQSPINSVNIVDYFPEDIIDNFEFSYIGNPSVGTTSDTIDIESKTITWNIDTLKGDEVATLKYKLKIKDMQNTNLLNKTIATNEKVVLTYKDTGAQDYTVELTSSPKIQLSEIKEELTATVSYNPTTNTTGNVVATIKTNKRVNKVDGWTLSEDGKILTKTYSKNATETVHLIDLDGMEKDVQVKITNIDTTTAPGKLPQTGISYGVVITIIVVLGIGIVAFRQYRKYKDI